MSNLEIFIIYIVFFFSLVILYLAALKIIKDEMKKMVNKKLNVK